MSTPPSRSFDDPSINTDEASKELQRLKDEIEREGKKPTVTYSDFKFEINRQ